MKEKIIYGVYFPYHKNVLNTYIDELPDYPINLRKIGLYESAAQQLYAFSETPCPASQMFTCKESEINDTILDLDMKFQDKDWLRKNIEPFV